MPRFHEWLRSFRPIAGGALESNINGLWVAKQSGKGSPASMAAGSKRLRWVGGDVQTNRADGSENFSDNTLFGDTVDFVNTILGNGAPVAQGQSGVIAYLAWLAAGQETVTGGVDAVQTIPKGTATGGTFVISVTIAAGPYAGTYTTAALPFNATSAAIATAVGNLTPLKASGGTVVGGGASDIATGAVTLTFGGKLGKQPIPLLVVDGTALTGGTIGAVTTTTVGKPFTHVVTPADTGGFYSTWLKSVGKSVIHRSQYNDCRITQMRLEGSSASKIAKVTPTFLSLDAGQVPNPNADPTGVDDGTRPFIYTEAAGTVNIDGQVFRGVSSFASVLTWGLQEWYGDDVVPYDVINQRANATLEAITILLDTQGLTRYNNQIYGKSNPAPGDKPLRDIPLLGSYSIQFNKINPFTGLSSESLQAEYPGIKWNPDLNIPANPDGGAVEFPMAAEFRKVQGQPPWRITTNNADPAYTA